MAQLLQIAHMGNSILRAPTVKVEEPLTQESLELGENMVATIKEVGGMGLSAPQVYKNLRLIVLHTRPNSRYPYAPQMDPIIMFNPEITWHSKDTSKDWEGCLSIPGIRVYIARYDKLYVAYRGVDGKKHEEQYEGFTARVIQHEMDHLEKTLIIDRVESTYEIFTEREYSKILAGD